MTQHLWFFVHFPSWHWVTLVMSSPQVAVMEEMDFERRRELRRQKREEMRLEAERWEPRVPNKSILSDDIFLTSGHRVQRRPHFSGCCCQKVAALLLLSIGIVLPPTSVPSWSRNEPALIAPNPPLRSLKASFSKYWLPPGQDEGEGGKKWAW